MSTSPSIATADASLWMNTTRSGGDNEGRGAAAVAYIVHTFDMGGLERCVANLVNSLDRTQFRPIIICLSRSGSAVRWIRTNDVAIVEVQKKSKNDPFAVKRLARILRDHRVRIVHSHNWGTLIETVVSRHWAKVPVHIHTEHGQESHFALRGIKRRFRRWATRWGLEHTDVVIACAESVRSQLLARSGFPISRIVFSPNGVDDPLEHASSPQGPDAIRSLLNLPNDALIVGSLSRLVPVKDFITAIDAFALIAQQRQNARLVLVGDGPEKDSLRRRAQLRGIDGLVHFPGRQENTGDWLRLFDVYINSSRSEAMSMGILEALGAGVPVVATDVGDSKALLEGPACCGLTVPAGNAPALAKAIDELLLNHVQRRHMATNARRQFVENYNVASMVERHSTVYSHVLATKREGSLVSRTRSC